MKRPLTLPGGRTAALFIDLQEEHRQDRRFLAEDFDRVLAHAASLQRAARARRIPLYHCAFVVDGAAANPPFHPLRPDGRSLFSDRDDPLTAICPEVAPAAGETLLIKNEPSAFGAASPAEELRARGVEWLVVAGVWTEACVDASVKDAVALGLRVLLVKDACASGSRAMHETAILNLANRLYGGAVADTAAACRLIAGDTVPAWQLEGAVPFRYGYDTASALYQDL